MSGGDGDRDGRSKDTLGRGVCVGSGQRPARLKFTLGLVECPWCGKRIYLTMQGKLYKHRERVV